MRASMLFLAFLLIAAPAYAQDFERLDRRFERLDLAAAKARRAEKHAPSLALSVITPGDPGAVLNGGAFVAGPSFRLAVQWSF
jgi:hypothetical protein